MSDHKTRYLLAAENQPRYDEFTQTDEPECLEAELALARTLCEQAANAGHHHLAAVLLQTITRLSAAVTEQQFRMGELLAKDALRRFGEELVVLVTNTVQGRFAGWEDALEQMANQLTTKIEATNNNEPEEQKLLEGPRP